MSWRKEASFEPGGMGVALNRIAQGRAGHGGQGRARPGRAGWIFWALRVGLSRT